MSLQAVRRSRLSLGFAVIATLLLTPAVLSAQEIIAFESQRDGNPEVYVTNVDGTNQRRLTTNSSFDGEPAFSLTGEKIAFRSDRDGNSEIYIMNADGSLQTNLTNNPAFDGHPTFSPDGKKIAFVSDRGGHLGIWVMNVDGSNPTELAGGVGGSEPAFNIYGTKIVFSGPGNSADSDIWVMDADGSNPNNVSQDARADDSEPSFSPDGTKIVFTKDVHDGSGSEIFVMNADGTNPINLTNIKGSDYHPSFDSAPGNLITFTTLRDGNAEIYVMNADGSWPINVTRSPGLDEMPAWGWKFNHPPVLSNLVVSSPINEGDTATLSGEITDPDENDTFTLDIMWGDGQSQSIDYPAGTTTFELTHRYLDDPPAGAPFGDDYLITVTASNDHRAGIDSRGLLVTVNNLNPIIIDAIVSPPGHNIVAGGSITLFLNYTDPGYHGSPGDEDLRAFIQWGDGQNLVVATGRPEAISFTHQYTAVGNYSINIEVTDNDGGVTNTICDVVVSAPPPPAAPTNFQILSVGANQIQLGWTDASTTEDGFAIERCTSRGCNNFVEIGRVGPNTTTYLDGTVAGNTQYSYRMRAFNTGGVSPYTNVVSAKTPRR
jgi:Tol biopolymer transport system component